MRSNVRDDMQIIRWVKALSWVVVAVATAVVGLMGLNIASASVIRDRSAILGFGIAGAIVTLSLMVATKGLWKLIALPVGLLYCWCGAAGWDVESPRFESAQGGPWFDGVPFDLVGLLALLGVASTILSSGHPRKPKREQDLSPNA